LHDFEVRIIRKNLEKKVPSSYQQKILDQATQIQEKYNLSDDEAYLAAFKTVYNQDINFRKQVKLTAEEKAVISMINVDISKIDAQQLVSADEVQSQIINFTQKNEYKDQLKNSVDTSIDIKNVSNEQLKFLIKQYSQDVKNFLDKNNLKQEDLQSYLE